MKDKDLYIMGVRFDQNGLARVMVDGEDKMYYVDMALNPVTGALYGGKCVGKNIYVLEETRGRGAYYCYKDGKFEKETQELGQCFSFHNGIALVRERDNVYCDVQCSYYINEDFERVSPIYLDASQLDENGVADVVDFSKKCYMINEKFEQISKDFHEVYEPDKNGVIIGVTKTRNGAIYEYHQLIDGRFECVSPKYKYATYFKGDAAVVQDYETGLYYVVNKNFERISSFYEDMIRVYGDPGIVMVKEDGKKAYLTTETMSKINDPKIYSRLTDALEKKQHDALYTAFEDYVTENDLENDKYVNDLKVAVKDYLIRNSQRLAFDDMAGSYFMRTVAPKKIDKRIDVKKLIKWIEREVTEAPDRVREMLELKKGS